MAKKASRRYVWKGLVMSRFTIEIQSDDEEAMDIIHEVIGRLVLSLGTESVVVKSFEGEKS
jgi:hypothetical protein